MANIEGKPVKFDADSVALAVGYRSNQELADQLKAQVSELYVIGDCSEPRRILEATRGGYRTGIKI